MNEDRFDDIIKEKISNHLPSGKDGTWDIFEKKFGRQLINDTGNTSFDQFIKANIKNNRTVFKNEHWNILNQQLALIEERRNVVWGTKTLELLAILLIIFTYFNIPELINLPGITPYAGHPNEYASEDRNELQMNCLNALTFKRYTLQQNQVRKSNISKPGIVVGSKAIPENTLPSNILFTQNAEISVRKTEITDKDTYISEPMIDPEQKSELNFEITNAHDALINNVDNNLPFLDQVPFTNIYTEIATSLPVSIIPLKQVTKFSVGAFVSADINLINTPFDKLYSLASYTKEAYNNSFGFNFSAEKNDLEVQTGFGYAQREYQPKIIKEDYAQFSDHYFEKSLNKISFDIATIPLNLKYHFLNQHNWSVYFMTGAVLNIVINAEYDINETLKQGRSSARFTPDQARLDEKPFIKGIFNGDKIKDNYFVTVGFGFGVEKQISNSTSLYLQPSYQRQILSADIGIGPNKDNIHTSSLQFGVKTVIN